MCRPQYVVLVLYSALLHSSLQKLYQQLILQWNTEDLHYLFNTCSYELERKLLGIKTILWFKKKKNNNISGRWIAEFNSRHPFHWRNISVGSKVGAVDGGWGQKKIGWLISVAVPTFAAEKRSLNSDHSADLHSWFSHSQGKYRDCARCCGGLPQVRRKISTEASPQKNRKWEGDTLFLKSPGKLLYSPHMDNSWNPWHVNFQTNFQTLPVSYP